MGPDDEFPLVDTGNGYAANLAATTNDRLKKTVLELRSVKGIMDALNRNLETFSESSERYSTRLIHLTWALIVLTVILVVLTVIIVVLTFALIGDAREQTSSQNSISLNAQYFTASNMDIIAVMQRDEKILIENGGKFTSTQLDSYLDAFDTIYSQYEKALLTEADLCGSFSYYIELTAKNPEIREYIALQQKTDAGFFAAFQELEDTVKNSENINCE